MISSDELFGFLTHQLPYDQKIVSYINVSGLQHYVNKFTEIPPLNTVTLKVEGMERYSEKIWNLCRNFAQTHSFNGPITAHCFLAHTYSPSFGRHTDPDDVIIYCTEGIKCLYVEKTYYELQAGDSVYIPANTPHEIFNKYHSVILSIGFEKYMIDKVK
jgi:quercetin dioxygenase-like cupin family protein